MRFRTVFLLFSIAGSIYADVLDGSGNNLLLPSTTGATPPGIVPVVTLGTGSFSGTWSSTPAPTAWQGTFNGTGNFPCCGNADVTNWSFSGLTNGYLPTGTFFRLGDVDNGETLSLTAFNNLNQIIMSPWLNVASFVSSPTPSDLVQANLPGWSFAGGTYTFTGRFGVNGNTILTILLPSNQNIFGLRVNQPDSTAGFGLSAPTTAPVSGVPEPGTYGLIGAALGVIALRKRSRKV